MAQEQEKQEKPFRVSIFLILAVLFVALVVVPLLSYSWKSISTSKDYIEESLRERQLKTAMPAAAHIQNLMDEYKRRLVDLAAIFEIYAGDANFKTEYETLLQKQILDRFLSDDALLLVYQDREGLQFPATSKGLTSGEQAVLINLVTPVGRQSLEKSESVTSRAFPLKLAAGGGLTQPAVAVTVPIRTNGPVHAVVTGVFLLREVQDSLKDYSREFTIFVTDDGGRLLFHSDPKKAGKAEDLASDPAVRHILDSFFPASAANFTVDRVVDGRRVTLLVTCAPIGDYRWLLFSEVDQSKYYAPITELKQQFIIWLLLSILAALAIGLLLARVITKPISTLAEVSRELARGNFSHRADVRSHTEIGELAQAFNAMADDIQVYIQKVEAAADETKQLFMHSIRAIANALDAKDPYTRGHSERVSAYAMIVSREFGLDERELRIMEISSMLHDVGKIGIEDKILRKPGALTNEEFTMMKMHPGKGAEILGSIPQMRDIIPGIRCHHERWAGGGYPDGLKGENIPLLARIIGVADAFDAMTTNRPYQKAMTQQQAAARINELTPSVYEPKITAAFNSAFRKGLFSTFARPVPAPAPPPQTKTA